MRKKLFSNLTIIFCLLLMAIYVIVLLLRIHYVKELTIEEFLDKISEALIGIILPILILNIIYEHLTKSYYYQELSEKLSEALVLTREIIDNFSEAFKSNMIRLSTESILGQKEGDMIFNAVISPYLQNRYSFREDFRYYVSFYEEQNLERLEDVAFEKDEYYWLYQDISYTRKFDRNTESIYVGFAYDVGTLDIWLKRNVFFFRELVSIRTEHQNMIVKYDIEQIKKIVAKWFELSLWLGDYELPYQIVLPETDAEKGFMLKFALPNERNEREKDKDKEYRFRLRFRMPHEKEKNRFIVAIPEPTKDIYIHFTHMKDNLNVAAIPFFDEFGGHNILRLKNNTIIVELKKWVLPRSGIVFVWDNHSVRNSVK